MEKINYTIRELDESLLKPYFTFYFYEEVEELFGTFDAQWERFYENCKKSFKPSKDVKVFLVLKDEQVIGGCQVNILRYPNGRNSAYLSNLLIASEYRRNGIGTTLVEKATEYAKQEGAVVLTLETLKGDNEKEADAFYKTFEMDNSIFNSYHKNLLEIPDNLNKYQKRLFKKFLAEAL